METVDKYGRLSLTFKSGISPDSIEYGLPDGSVEKGPVFHEFPVRFTYDVHGYETSGLDGPSRLAARYTPIIPGQYGWRALSGDDVLATGSFICVESLEHGHVGISAKDPRYFAHADGTAYVPIGLNLVGADYYKMPAGHDHFEASNLSSTPGCLTYERWFRDLSANGGNYARLWLSSRYFEIRTETPGNHNLEALAHLDGVVHLARKYGIRLKLCLEHFRTFTQKDSHFYRCLRDPETGEQLTDIESWFNDEKWNALWLQDISPYLALLWNDPIVFAWELWNENDCGEASFESVRAWTQRMLPQLKRRSPANLVVNSLGSFDETWKQGVQDAFRDMPEMDFQQVHRYLDQGSPWDICHEDGVLFSINAVQLARRADKPVILTETGAVNDRHVGPFRFYQSDHDGLIFQDVTYPAFFAGAAGTGHIWHWADYVEAKNLWKGFLPFSKMLEGVSVDAEDFREVDWSTETAWAFGLSGNRHQLLFVRNRSDRWDHVLRDNLLPQAVERLTLPVTGAKTAQAFWLCGEEPGVVHYEEGILTLPPFLHGCVIRVTL